MNNRERVLASLHHQQPDKTPYDIGFTQPAYAKMADYYGDPEFGSKLGNCLTIINCAAVEAFREITPDILEDPFGVQWDRKIDKDIGVVSNRLITRANVDEFEFPDPDDARIWTTFPAARGGEGDKFIVANHGFSLFERAWTLAGMDNVLMAMVADSRFANRLLDRILEYNLRLIEHACSCGIDAMMFGDDWGSQRGLLMGPALWREYIGPRVKQMYQAVKAKGKFVFIHSCGKVDELFPDLIASGLDVFNPFQPEVISVFEIKKTYGGRLCFYGGISTQKTLPYATPAQTREEVKRLISDVGKNGGYFASPAHAIPADARPENIAAMIEVLQDQ